MAGDTEPQRPKGLSLYANLLDKDIPGTISGAPVTYTKNEPGSEQDEAAKKQQAIAASLRFQPTKRPQLAAQKAKAKAIASKLAAIPSQSVQAQAEVKQDAPVEITQQAVPKTSAADWIATVSEDEDVNAYYSSTKQRRKKRKKNNKDQPTEFTQDWDDIYDPSRPNNYEEYKQSEEKIREVRDWKDLLYRHRMRNRKSSDYNSDRSEPRTMNKQFAPPPMSFAPPPNLNDDSPPPPPPPANLPDDPTGDDAYQRRLRISQNPPPPPPPPPPPEPSAAVLLPSSAHIARAPVRYSAPPSAPPEAPEEETKPENDPEPEIESDQPRSNRPGQKGFAERLLSKYGWTKGSGLGAQGTGIINPLYAKADKRKKKSDAEGGGFATPANTGKILGGTKSKAAQKEEEGKFGKMSEVVRLEGMLDGMDVQAELSRMDEEGSGGLMQEIGSEGEKYGNVERVFIYIPEDNGGAVMVFICFVSQLSALRAVNALDGRTFNGNTIRARYWDKEKFDDGMYS